MGPNALFSFDYFIIMTCSCPLSKVRRLPYSHLPGLTIGLPANAQLSWFLQSHLDSFIVTQNSQPSTGIRPSTGIIPSCSFTVTQDFQLLTGIIPSIQFCLDIETFSHLPGLYLDQKLPAVYRDFAKTHASACRGRQLN